MTGYRRPALLSEEHDVSGFDCGSAAQTGWLRKYAFQAQRSDSARVYVVCPHDSHAVVGHYALAAGSLTRDQAPPRVTKGLGRYPIPVVILARLGVDVREQGSGLGSSLVRDALLQTASIADRLGVRALLIHAESEQAAGFYRHLDPAFEPSPSDALHLILLTKDLRAAVREAVDDLDDLTAAREAGVSEPSNAERLPFDEVRRRLGFPASQDDPAVSDG